MGDAAEKLKMTFAEYLAFERASEQKHEFIGGEIYAMSGGTREHSAVTHNFARELGNALLDRPCEVHGPDLRVKAGDGDCHYPDGLVVCGEPVFEDEKRDALLNPTVSVEVLSPSSARYDRRDKFESYQTIASLTDYILASQERVRVEHFHRMPDGSWNYRALGAGDALVLEAIGCTIPVDRLYLKVFPPAGG